MHSKRFQLLYVFPEPLPLSRARGVQVAHFVNALAQQGAMVTLAYVPSGSEHPFVPLGIEVPNGVVLLPLSRQLPGLLGALSMKSHRLFMWRLARWRLMLGRVYLNGAADRKLQFELSEDQLHIRPGPRAEISAVSKGFMASLRQATNHAGFHIPAISPLGHGTSSHYGGTLPYGGPLVDVQSSGRIAPGVYLADASTFPSLPAISPTFTIMANACRTAYEGLQD